MLMHMRLLPGLAPITRTTILAASQTQLLQRQPSRAKGNVLQHRKPRWVPVAKTKKFVLPPIDHTPDDEVQLMKRLDAEYTERFSAMTQYLYEDHVRFSDVGDMALKEAAREAEEHRALVLQNEEHNKRVAEARKIRLQEEEQQQLSQAKDKIKLAAVEDRERLRKAAVTVSKEAESLKNSVTLETLRKALEDAVDNPVDYEYAIDTEGHIYRGRYTKSVLVPPGEREKIPVPQSDLLIDRN